MKLKNILKDIVVLNLEELNLDKDIMALNNKAQKIFKDSLFFCYDGENYRAKDIAKVAVKNGACVLVVEKALDSIDCEQVQVADVRKAMSIMAKNFYEISDNLKFIGVTGTNGKTTTTSIIKQILCDNNLPAGLIGTEGCFYNNKQIERGLTTPDPIELFSIIRKMQDNGILYIVMEVSAHAIALNKINAIKFDIKILTNITQDHLDYFKTMSNYANTKLAFLTDDAVCIVNKDDKYINEFLKNTYKTFSLFQKSDIYVRKIYLDGSFEFWLNGKTYICKNNFKGDFNISNIISSILCAYYLGINIEKILYSVSKIAPVVGRLNTFKTVDDITIVVDFAHTPDGLCKVLKTVRKFTKNNLICVFGCGGNRDAKKRPQMGKIAEELSDFVIITDDNPRFEKEDDIAKEIESGMRGLNHKIICDRKKAIMYTKYISSSGDTIIYCGKGAENYQDVNGVKYPYNEFDEINKNFEIKK